MAFSNSKLGEKWSFFLTFTEPPTLTPLQKLTKKISSHVYASYIIGVKELSTT